MDSDLLSQIASQFDTLPSRLGGHIFLSLTALFVGIVLSVPLGVWAAPRPRVEKTALLLTSVIQTIPSLALLALMVFAWGTIGWIPALIALILYSLLPMLRNTITGLQGIDPAILEAADGVGMNRWQALWLVRLPLAMPTMVAGIRTASVWVVGAATIAQPVGATSLGNYIFVGLQTFNPVSLLFGCFFAALLALTLDGLLHGLERAARVRNLRLAGIIGCGLLLLAFSPLILSQFKILGRPNAVAVPGEDFAVQDDPQQNVSKFVVGSKPFTEQYILADLIAKRLRAGGMEVEVKDGMGSATTLLALETGELDCYVDYTGTIWTNFMKKKELLTRAEILIEASAYLLKEKQIVCLGTLGFSNDYVFVMSRDRAEQLGIQDLYELAKQSSKLKAGGDIEFFDRLEWRNVKKVYGLDFEECISMDSTLMYGAVESGQIDVAVAYGTDGRINRYDLAVLDDPAVALPPYDAMLVVSPSLARNHKAVAALRPLLQAIGPTQMQIANGMVDEQGATVEEAAEYLEDSIKKQEMAGTTAEPSVEE